MPLPCKIAELQKRNKEQKTKTGCWRALFLCEGKVFAANNCYAIINKIVTKRG
jgi:hypothetical protein